MKYIAYKKSLCYYCKNNLNYATGYIDCRYEKRKVMPRSICAAQLLTSDGWSSKPQDDDVILKIDKNILKIYKEILINKLKSTESWTVKTPYHNETVYTCTGINTGDSETDVIFEIRKNKIFIKLNGNKIYYYNLYTNLDLYYCFKKLKSNIKKLEFNMNSRLAEEVLKDKLPDTYKRKLKIINIKNKI